MTMSLRTLAGVAAVGLGLAVSSGCQTNVAGMTLPSGHYLEHPPQYIPPSPPYPLPREIASIEAINAAQAPGAGPIVPLPAPVVVPVVPAAPAQLPAPVPAPAPAPNP